MPYFTEPEEVIDYFYNLLRDNQGPLGLGYVGYSEEALLPKYPAVVVSFNAPVDRVLYATRTFQLNWSIQLIVYHAKLTQSHKERSRQDMQLAAAVRDKLHEDFRLGGGVVSGFVTSERPGVVADYKGQANIATVLIWQGESRASFPGT